MKKVFFGILFLILSLAIMASADNLALGKKYVVNYPAEATYPDSGTELTDGKLAQLSIYDSGWAGHLRNEYRIFIVDLEDVYKLEAITISALQDKGTGVTLPLWVCYSVSLDGKKWKSVGTLDFDEDELPTKNTARMEYKLETSGVKARYVAIKINSGVWLFVDEIQALGDPNTKEVSPSGLTINDIDFEEIEFDY